jgi:hypothetical protein
MKSPVVVMEVTVILDAPLLIRMAFLEALVVPINCAEKLSEAGDAVASFWAVASIG